MKTNNFVFDEVVVSAANDKPKIQTNNNKVFIYLLDFSLLDFFKLIK